MHFVLWVTLGVTHCTSCMDFFSVPKFNKVTICNYYLTAYSCAYPKSDTLIYWQQFYHNHKFKSGYYSIIVILISPVSETSGALADYIHVLTSLLGTPVHPFMHAVMWQQYNA